ncbi:MAG: alpha/beta hydrolase [Minwuia sp.]|nr:alpha/beta hydrolase [Minwuia sp.]
MTEQDHLKVQAAAPDWYREAMANPGSVHQVENNGCRLQYMKWSPPEGHDVLGSMLLVHGGGGHGHWWSHLAPMLAQDYHVVAMDQAGMGDSGTRDETDARDRAHDMLAVIEHANLGPGAFVVGHSFGGLMAMRLGQLHGDRLGGIIIADSPVRNPDDPDDDKNRRPQMGNKRHYADFDSALARFRLMPEQTCENTFLVEHIGRRSIRQEPEGWTWKFDGGAMQNRRFGEPFHEYMANMKGRRAFVYGEDSKLVRPELVPRIKQLLGPEAPVVGIPKAQHHLILDQPLAFVATIRAILAGWLTTDG